VEGKPLRIATTHLQSMHLAGKENGILSKDQFEDSLVILHGTMIEKLNTSRNTTSTRLEC
jgi:hypothetical protein